jgi:aspartyl-tRNA(Asn)/glutamyl-tRNA(Gln) amidotransferase subunit A
MAGVAFPGRRHARALAGARLAVSPRIGFVELEGEVAAGFEAAADVCARLGASVVHVDPPLELDILSDYFDVFGAEMLAYHRRFDGARELYRPSIREFVERAEERALPAEAYVAAQGRRRDLAAAWADWLAAERIDAVLEPTVPEVARLRGPGYDHAGSDLALILLTHYWNWTGLPVVALPAGLGAESGLPVGVSLIGPAGSDWRLLELGIELQAELGVPAPQRIGGPPKSVV